MSNQSKSIRSEKKGEQRMKQDKAERERWPYCEHVRSKANKREFFTDARDLLKKIIKASDDLPDKITVAINYFDRKNIICI